MYPIQRAQVRKLLPLLAGHLVEQRALHVHNFIVRQRQNKVLTPRVDQTKRQRVVIAAAKQRIGLKILQRVVHPAHVPFEIETEAAGVNRMTHHGPGGRFFRNHHRAGTLAVRHFIQLLQTAKSLPDSRGRQIGSAPTRLRCGCSRDRALKPPHRRAAHRCETP